MLPPNLERPAPKLAFRSLIELYLLALNTKPSRSRIVENQHCQTHSIYDRWVYHAISLWTAICSVSHLDSERLSTER